VRREIKAGNLTFVYNLRGMKKCVFSFNKSLLLLSGFLLGILVLACNKNRNNGSYVIANASLTANFDFKPGSYWIYKDSISGQTDSAYVDSNYMDTGYISCYTYPGIVAFEEPKVFIRVYDYNPADSEVWILSLEDTAASLSFYNNRDMVESELTFPLFTYPFRAGAIPDSPACALLTDSAYISSIFPVFTVNNQPFSTTAQSVHVAMGLQSPYFNDCFYISASAGLVKVVFNHSPGSDHRALQLLRYNIVR
jgi:hypothetical protein